MPVSARSTGLSKGSGRVEGRAHFLNLGIPVISPLGSASVATRLPEDPAIELPWPI